MNPTTQPIAGARTAAIIGLVLLTAGCEGERRKLPGGGIRRPSARDAAPVDATQVDTGASSDGGADDAGQPRDTAVPHDTGVLADSGVRVDTGAPVDTGVRVDTGVLVDTGVDPDYPDAGFADSGVAPDSGVVVNPGCGEMLTDSWRTTNRAGEPGPRYWQATVWTGTEAMVWGGRSSGRDLNTGGLYDPETDTWRTVPTTGAPSGRFNTIIVWTGTEVLVWGGRANGGLASGGAFNPNTMTWRTMSNANGPTAAAEPEGVWTGSELVVWGDDTVIGARYDPTTDRWTRMNTSGAPSPRDGFTMTAISGEVFVWSGRSCGGGQCPYPANGARYDLTNNRWTPVSTSGAPTGAAFGTGVFDGADVLVFGGRTCGTVSPGCDIAEAMRYNPSHDSWTALPSAGQPSRRHSHTGVWTGDRMIIWGGATSHDTGAIYDPASNSWTAMSQQGAPAGRYLHSGVWTDHGLFIWGGSTAGLPDRNTGANGGAMYCPP